MATGPAAPLYDRIEDRLQRRFGADRTAALLLAAAMVVWPIIEAMGGQVLSSMPPLELVWLRYAAHLVLLFLLAGRRQPAALVRTKYLPLQTGRALLMLGMPVFWVAAAARMPNAAVMSVFWLNPLVAIAGAFLLLGERPRLRDVVLALAGWAAIVMAFGAPRPSGLGGPILAVGMTACYALYLVGTRWLRREPTAVNLFYSAFVVFVVLTPMMPFVWVTPPISALPRIVAIGALGLLLLFLIDRALHLATVARTAAVGFLQPAVELLLFGAASGALATNVARLGLLITLFVVSLCVLMGVRTTTELTTARHD